MSIVKNILNKITNGMILIFFGIMHSNFVISKDGFGVKFEELSNSYYFRISEGLDELPATSGITDFETFAAFWFFYFGLLMIPLGILLHHIERKERIIPQSFTISYLLLVLTGSYMVPNSGMTFIMLPHAIYMIVVNYFRGRINKFSSAKKKEI